MPFIERKTPLGTRIPETRLGLYTLLPRVSGITFDHQGQMWPEPHLMSRNACWRSRLQRQIPRTYVFGNYTCVYKITSSVLWLYWEILFDKTWGKLRNIKLKNEENIKVLLNIFSQGWTMARMRAYNSPSQMSFRFKMHFPEFLLYDYM